MSNLLNNGDVGEVTYEYYFTQWFLFVSYVYTAR